MRRRRFFGWLLLAGLTSAGANAADDPSSAEHGRAIYFDARRTDGIAITVLAGAAGVPLAPAFAGCVNCHAHHARGKSEAGTTTSDIRWETLSRPMESGATGARPRPAYDERAFFVALTRGLDPAGRTLDPTMPRFALTERDAADVLGFLRQIGHAPVEGVDERTIRIGWIAQPDTNRPEQPARERALVAGEFAAANRNGGIFRRQLEMVDVAPDTSAATVSVLALIDATDRVENSPAENALRRIPRLRIAASGAAGPARYEFSLYGRHVAARRNEGERAVALHALARLLVHGLKNAGRHVSTESLVETLESTREFRSGALPEIGFTPQRHTAFP